MIEIKTYRRLPLPDISATQVTEDNMAEIAEWCKGEVRTAQQKNTDNTVPYIKVDVKRPMTARQTKAFVGDWVLQAGSGFKVYTPVAFEKCFTRVLAADETELDDVVDADAAEA